MDPQLEELNRKIDALTAQVTYLTEQAREGQRIREAGEELIDTALPIARGAMDLASKELEEVQEYLDHADLIRLLKKIVRHGPELEMMLDSINGVTDLIETVGPITKEGMDMVTSIVTEMDSKGYFTFAQGGLRMVDNIVCNFTEEDVNHLGDNIVLILNVIKDMTQPEIMNFVRSTLLVAESEVQKPVDSSLFSLMNQMRDPAVRRGLALTMRVLRVIGTQTTQPTLES